MREELNSASFLSVRRATARKMWHSRADISIIKLPSQLSITQQGSRRPWSSRRWACKQTPKHPHKKGRAHQHCGSRQLPLDFQLSLANLLQQSNWIQGCQAKTTMDKENMWHIINDSPVLSLAYTSMMHKAPMAFTDAPGWMPPLCCGSLSHLSFMQMWNWCCSEVTKLLLNLNPWNYKCITLLVEMYLEIKPN